MKYERTTTEKGEPMPRVKIGSRRQITIPAETIKRLGLNVGEELELVERDEVIVLVPRKHVGDDQAWFWTDEWQQRIREAEADIKAGRVAGPFESVDDLIRELHS